MTSFLYQHKIRIFDYPDFSGRLRDEIRNNAEKIARENALEIEFIRKKNFRKEARIREIIEHRGNHAGLVHIFSAMEPCPAYKPWHDKKTHRTFLKYTAGKCLHYYFYFIDEYLGLCYVRVPTWCPFRLQIYFNGHNMLASFLKAFEKSFTLVDNAFLAIDNFDEAQSLCDNLDVELLHKKLNDFALRYCPVIGRFDLNYHWSIMQVEYATDIIFKDRKHLKAIYDQLTRTAIHTVKPENIATFLGRKLHFNYQDEMGTNFNTRIQGTRIKHTMGPVSIKMYDKFGLILRIETTVNDVSFFKHYRKVEHRDGTISRKNAAMKKGIYSFNALQPLLLSSNYRYLQFISAFDIPTIGIDRLEKVCKTIPQKGHSYKGFNFFDDNDQRIFEAIASGQFNISGFQNKNLRNKIPDKTSSQMTRIIKRLHVHRLIKKVSGTYKYYVSALGRQVIALGLKLKHLVITKELAASVI